MGMVNVKTMWSETRAALSRVMRDAPRLLLAALRTRTGKTVLASALTWGSARIGLTWPHEQVSWMLQSFNISVTPSGVADALAGICLTWGTLFANDGVGHVRARAFPRRWYVPHGLAQIPMSVRVAPVRVAGRLFPSRVMYYELRMGAMYAMTEAGEVPVDVAANEHLISIYELLRSDNGRNAAG